MVNSIKGNGDKLIITTKPRAKEAIGNTDGKNFDKSVREKMSGDEPQAAASRNLSHAENNLKILQQQQLVRMQHLESIAEQIKNGTYRMVSPEILAEKMFQLLSDKKVRQKFLKKLFEEESENVARKDKPLSELELKKLVFMIRETQDEPFDDPELEALLNEFG